MITNKDAFGLARKNNKKKKLRYFIMTTIITLMLFMIILPFSYYKSENNRMKNYLKYEYQTKTIQLSINNDESLEIARKVAKEDNRVVRFIENYVPYYRALITNIKEDRPIGLYIKSAVPYNSPNNQVILEGRTLKNDDEIVCSSMIFVDDQSTIDNAINMSDYLGQTLKFRFRIYDNGDFTDNYIERQYKLVGIYNEEKNYEYQTCYITENAYESQKDEIIKEWNEAWGGVVYVKDYFDVEDVSQKFPGMSPMFMRRFPNYPKTVLTIVIIEAVIIMIMNIIAFIIYLKGYIKNNYKSLTLYKALGFTKEDSEKIILFQIGESFITAIVIATVITFIGTMCLRYYLYRKARFYIENGVKIDCLAIFIFLMLLFLIIKYMIKRNTKIIENLTVKELSKE